MWGFFGRLHHTRDVPWDFCLTGREQSFRRWSFACAGLAYIALFALLCTEYVEEGLLRQFHCANFLHAPFRLFLILQVLQFALIVA